MQVENTTTPQKFMHVQVELSLDDYIMATPTITKERWDILDNTFNALHRLSASEPHIQQILDDLFSFCKASQETKECIARASQMYHFNVDNHLILVMNNIDTPEKTSGYTPNDIIGFTLSRKGKDSIHVSQCMVHSTFRRRNFASTMIASLCAPTRTSISKVTTSVRPSLEALKFFAQLGFVHVKNQLTTLFKEIVRSDNLLQDIAQLGPIVGTNNMIDLVHYSTCCHTCRDPSKKTRQCGSCHTVSYCSIECQKNDWSSHQQHCVSQK